MEEEQIVLVCMAVGKAKVVVDGSTHSTCAGCQCKVWAAPTTVQIVMKKKDAVIYCLDCAAKLSNGKLSLPTPIQMKEIRENLDKMRVRLN